VILCGRDQFRSADRPSSPNGSLDASPLEPTLQQWATLCQNYLELEQALDAPLPRNYPPEYNVAPMPIKAAAESIAVAERQRLGLGDGPIRLLREVLEQSVGLRIFYVAMPWQYAGLYSYSEPLGGCIAINRNHPEDRQRRTLAHEYLHFLADRHRPLLDSGDLYQRKNDRARLADLFPDYFLMPTSGLLQRFNDMYRSHGKFTPTNLFTLAHYYGVAIEALVTRLEGLELIPSQTWERLRGRGLKVRETQTGLEQVASRSERPDMMPIHYQHLAIEALDQGLITEGRFADLLAVDRLEARRIAAALREHSSGILEKTADFDLRQA
jgi:Zn-dependent peptidase ImmA (M78 family)